MNILILHNMGDPRSWRHSVADLELCLPRYAPQHTYIIHNAWCHIPKFVKRLNFHAIVLGPTFLCARYNRHILAKFLDEYQFIATACAYKIALPQDDYDCSALLDSWVTSWQIDEVHTVCPNNWEILYPKYLSSGGNLRLGYTGYIGPHLIRRALRPKPHSDRPIDVCYRARKLSPNFGSIGRIKSEIAARFKAEFQDQPIVTDISINDVISGTKWLDFLENSKYTLGTNSGSSLLDPEGEIRACVNSYLAANPDATFAEVEAACFPGQDGIYNFTAISPRVLEAGLLKTGQILIPGPYSGVLEPWVHYVPLCEDLSNKEEVACAIKDATLLKRITTTCREKLMASPELMLESHVARLLRSITDAVTDRQLKSNDGRFLRAVSRYRLHIAPYEATRRAAISYPRVASAFRITRAMVAKRFVPVKTSHHAARTTNEY